MTRVLLTGAGGFVGSHLVRQLLQEGHQVTALLARTTRRDRIADVEGDVSILDSDLRNLEELEGRIREASPDICIHLAWHGWAGQAGPEENLSSLSASLDLLKLMPKVGCSRFVAAGTCFEYELDHERISEKTPLRPANIYALAKKCFFEMTREFAAITGLSTATARLFYSYGPWENERRVVPAIALAVLRGEVARVTPGEQVRDYLHVEDVASAIWAVARSDVTGPVNIASGEPVTIAGMARMIGEVAGRPDLVDVGAIPYREADPMRVLADASLLRNDVGWSPAYGLRDGLTQTVEWWRSHVSATIPKRGA